jgi:hypothetical protein
MSRGSRSALAVAALLMAVLVAPSRTALAEDPVSVPTRTLADDSPPAAAPDRSPSPSPPLTVLRTRYGRYRSQWYFGFGVGGGVAVVSDNLASYRSAGEGGVSAFLKVGWVAQPWLLVGFESALWLQGNTIHMMRLHHYDAVLTAFPFFDLGLYGKLGLGAGVAVLTTKGGAPEDSKTDAGVDLKLGAGYELPLGHVFNLGLDLSYTLTSYAAGKTHDFSGALTFSWY